MQVTSSSSFTQTEARNSCEGVPHSQINGTQKVEGNAQIVLESLKLNTIEQIRKNSNKLNNKKNRQLSSEMDEFDVEKINSKIIRKKESYEHNGEQATEKTKFTAATCVPDESRQASFSQNHNHSNILNENGLNKVQQKGETQSENNNQCQFHFNFQNNLLNNTFHQVTNHNTQGQFPPGGGSQLVIVADQEQYNQNSYNGSKLSYHSIQGADTLNELERRITHAKYLKSNQTLTTLTTAQNTQQAIFTLPLPSLSLVSKGSGRDNGSNTNCNNNNGQKKISYTSLLSKSPSFQGNPTNREIDQDLDIKFNNISQNNIDTNKSSMNLIQSDRYDKLHQDQIPEMNVPQIQYNNNAQQYILNSDSSQNNIHYTMDQIQDSPLPIKKLPSQYQTIMHARNHSLSEQQNRPDTIQQQQFIIKYQENQSMKELKTNKYDVNNNLEKCNQNLLNVHNNTQITTTFNNTNNTNLIINNTNTNHNQNHIQKNFHQTSNQNMQNNLKQLNNHQEQANNKNNFHQHLNNSLSNTLNISKFMKDFTEFDIKTARSQINLDLNLNYDESLSSSNKASFHNKNINNLNQQSTQQPRSGPSSNPSMKVKIENMDQMQSLRGNNNNANLGVRQPKTTFTTDIESRNKEYMNSFCLHPSMDETKQELEKNKIILVNDTLKGNQQVSISSNKINSNSSEETMARECQFVLNQIDQIETQYSNKVTQILKKYMKYDEFIKMLIIFAQYPIYSSEIQFKVQFQLKPDSFLKDVVVQEIKKLEKNQMLAFAEKQIERSSFYRIFQSFYNIFHSLFLKLIIFYLISCVIIFFMYFTNQETSLLLQILIVLTFFFQITLSIAFNYCKYLQGSKVSLKIFISLSITHIGLILMQQIIDDRDSCESFIISTVIRILQILISLMLLYYFYQMNKAARLFLLCFKNPLEIKMNKQQEIK